MGFDSPCNHWLQTLGPEHLLMDAQSAPGSTDIQGDYRGRESNIRLQQLWNATNLYASEGAHPHANGDQPGPGALPSQARYPGKYTPPQEIHAFPGNR